MASGPVSRTDRPNTWLLRPALRRDQSLDNPEPFSNRTPLVKSRIDGVPPKVMVLFAVGERRRNIRSEAQTLQCPQRARAWIARPNGFRRSCLHLRPGGQRVTFDRSGERTCSMKD
jgi:hypothetical protein